jgi:hypothetical protein
MFGKYNYLVNIERQEVAVCTASKKLNKFEIALNFAK